MIFTSVTSIEPIDARFGEITVAKGVNFKSSAIDAGLGQADTEYIEAI